MSGLLDEQYLTWLYGQVGSVKLKNPARTHWSLLRQLYITEFVWFVPNDDNRVEDGKDLRREFLEDYDISDPDPEWMRLGCSMLEMMVALSRRLSFETEGEPLVWFWHLIETLDLLQFSDKNYNNSSERVVNDVLNNVIFRTYDPDGQGGLFPLRSPQEDQRRVEIWYQMQEYLLEQF